MFTSAEKSFETCFGFFTFIYVIILHFRLPHNCLPQNLEHIYIFEYDLYIDDVKVSSEGRCLELLQ